MSKRARRPRKLNAGWSARLFRGLPSLDARAYIREFERRLNHVPCDYTIAPLPVKPVDGKKFWLPT